MNDDFCFQQPPLFRVQRWGRSQPVRASLVLLLSLVGIANAHVHAQCPEEDTCSNGGCASGTLVTTAGECGDCPVGTIVILDSMGTTDNDCFVGGPGPDTFISGIAGDDFICGNGGDDNLQARQGNDIICGGSGDDFIDAGSGDDYVHGGTGNDTILGDNGDDVVDGGEGDDSVDGGNGNDTVYGGAGGDTVLGGNATDVCIDDPAPTDPSCETATYAFVVRATVFYGAQRGTFFWQTSTELGTTGFDIVRVDNAPTQSVAPGLPASMHAHGAAYAYVMQGLEQDATYALRELTAGGAGKLVAYFAPSSAAGPNVSESGYHVWRNTRRAIPRAPQTEERRLLSGTSDIRFRMPGGQPVWISGLQLASWWGLDAAQVAERARSGELRFTHAGVSIPYLFRDAGVLLSVSSPSDGWRLPAIVVASYAQPGALAPILDLPSTSSAADAEARATTQFEQDVFAATVVPMLPDQDVMYWAVLAAGHSRYDSFSSALSLPDATGGEVEVELVLRGAVTGSHGLQVSLNGQLLGEVYINGREPQKVRVAGAIDGLAENANLELKMLPKLSYLPSSIVYLDRIAVDYPRALQAAGNVGMQVGPGEVFDVAALRATEGVRIAEDGLIEHLRVPESGRVRLPQAGSYFWFDDAFDVQSLPSVSLMSSAASQLVIPTQAPELIAVAPESLLGAAARYADLHRQQGLSTLVLSVDDVLDAFGGGYGTPDAIRRFLTALKVQSGQAPRFLTLFGPAHFDRRHQNTSEPGEVPLMLLATHNGLYADDGRHGDLDEDGLADLAVGRLSGNSEQLARYLDRLERYLAAERDLSQESWTWIADRVTDGVDFDQQLSAALGENLGAVRVDDNVELARAALFQSSGPVGYLGHGSMDQLGSQAWFTTEDVAQIQRDAPLFFLAGCAVGRHELPDHMTLAESLLFSAQGGPLSVLAPSGVSYSEVGADAGAAMAAALRDQQYERLGDAVLALQQRALAEPQGRLVELVRKLELFGDPALPLRPIVQASEDAGVTSDAAGPSRPKGADAGRTETFMDPLVAGPPVVKDSGCTLGNLPSNRAFIWGGLLAALLILRRKPLRSRGPRAKVGECCRCLEADQQIRT